MVVPDQRQENSTPGISCSSSAPCSPYTVPGSRQIARHRIVIGYRQHPDIALARQRHEITGAQGAVRGGGMGMEVNQHNLYT